MSRKQEIAFELLISLFTKTFLFLGSNVLVLGVVGGLLALLILGVIAFLIVCKVKGLKLRKQQVRVNV